MARTGDNAHEQRAAGSGAAASSGAPAGTSQVRGYGMGQARPAPAPQQMPYVHLPQGAYPPHPGTPGSYAPGTGYGQAPYPGSAAYVPPATSQAPAAQKKRGAAFWVCIIVIIICIALGCALAFTMCGGPSKRSGEAGQLEGKSEQEIQAELDRTVEEGMFNISIASTVQLESGTSEGDLRIENVPGNPYLMQVVITRDDTGEQIYATDMIEPNHHIQRDALDVDLDAGSYECTATFFACDMETEEVVGQAAAKMLVVVSG